MLQEITGNVYVLVDFILHSMMTRVQKGELEATILARVSVTAFDTVLLIDGF
jgi:hypothetical protein